MMCTQNQLLVPEGLAIVNWFIPESLHAALMQQIYDLADGTYANLSPTIEWNYVRLCQICFHQTSMQSNAACWHSWS